MIDITPQPLVLLVDDDKFLLDMYAMKFTKEGYKVQACLSVSEALEVLRSGVRPDALLSDIVMPEHDGFFLFAAIQKENLLGEGKLIALTNQGSPEEQIRAQSLGVEKYMIKATMIPSEVVQAVTALLSENKK